MKQTQSSERKKLLCEYTKKKGRALFDIPEHCINLKLVHTTEALLEQVGGVRPNPLTFREGISNPPICGNNQ